MNNKAIDILYLAKQNGIEVQLVEEQLQLKLPKNKDVDKNLLKELKDNKSLIVEFLKDNKRNNKNHSKISRVDKDNTGKIPLSFSQERLWFIDQLEGSIQYHISSVLRLKGKLNNDALNHSLKTIINRHEILRTVIRDEDGVGYQFIKEPEGWNLNMVDGRKYQNDDESLQKYIKQVVHTLFDLSEDYMLRAHLITINEEDHVLAVTLHHIASDGWSTSVLVNELKILYASYEKGGEAKLLPLPLQYSDYAIWQRDHLQGEVLNKKLSYWKDKLEGTKPLQLPTDFSRPAVQSTSGAVAKFNIDKDLADEIQNLSQQNGTTLFMTLLAAFKVLLYRYSDQHEVCVGIPIAGRQQKELEELIGYFINTLAIRSEVTNKSSFVSLLQQVKSTTLEAFDHQDVPFEKVVEAVVRERDQSRSPLFQVMFIFQNLPDIPQLELGEVKLSTEDTEHTTAIFDLILSMSSSAGGLKGAIQYDTDLFKKETMERMITHFRELLVSIVKSPHESIWSLPMLAKTEKEKLLVEFNNTSVDYPKESLVDLFEKQTLKHPDAVAVEFEEKQLTFKELNERANQLAHYLRGKGVKNEKLVPIIIERSLEMMVGILGVLKAGGAFIPIDTEYPEDRVRFMLDDAGADIILTGKRDSPKIPDADKFDIIELDDDRIFSEKQPKDNLQIPLNGSQLAYIIYTSGSTGKPKGVMIEQKSLINLVRGLANKIGFNSESGFLSVTTFSFDMCYLGVFLPFETGGRLIIVPKETAIDGNKLLECISICKPSHLQGTPATWHLLLDCHWKNKEGLRMLIGGEAVNEDIKDELTKIGETFNLYGPTETTVWSTFKKLELYEKVSAGKPIANTKIYIINELQEICPVMVAGEICISGAGLARGYFNRQELTAEKFVINPFYKESGETMFKTGDIGYWLPDGNIVVLGRKDFQVKIRGFRIELGEIESVLKQSDLVNQAVVTVKQDKQKGKRLVGYAIPKGTLDKEAIITYLKRKLPYYMVPMIWVEMDVMPLSSNGKVNRLALPEIDFSNMTTGKEYIAPANEIERALVGIWRKLLDVKKVGTSDNFFELGGHSLLALRLFSDIEKLSGKKLAISTLFASPTIKELAEIISDKGWSPPWKSLVPIKPDGARLPLYFVPPAAGTALHFQQLVKHISADQPVYVLEAIGLDGVSQPHTDLKEMAAFYVKEIQLLQPKGPYLLGGRCFGGRVAYEMAQQLINSGQKVSLLAIFDTWAPFLSYPEAPAFQEKNMKHFVSRSIHHLKTGLLFTVAKNYSVNKYLKAKREIEVKIKYLLSDQKKKLYDRIMYTHFKAQDKYLATKYPGKITLLECGTFRIESRERWMILAENGIESYSIPGSSHHTIFTEPFIRDFAEKLNFILDKANNEIEGKKNTISIDNKPDKNKAETENPLSKILLLNFKVMCLLNEIPIF